MLRDACFGHGAAIGVQRRDARRFRSRLVDAPSDNAGCAEQEFQPPLGSVNTRRIELDRHVVRLAGAPGDERLAQKPGGPQLAGVRVAEPQMVEGAGRIERHRPFESAHGFIRLPRIVRRPSALERRIRFRLRSFLDLPR